MLTCMHIMILLFLWHRDAKSQEVWELKLLEQRDIFVELPDRTLFSKLLFLQLTFVQTSLEFT